MDGRQPEAMPVVAGREERVEDPRQHPRLDADPVVADLQLPPRRVVARQDPARDLDPAAPGVAGVRDQVDHDLAEQAGIGLDHHRAGAGRDLQHGRRLDDPRQPVAELAEQGVRIEPHGDEPAAPGVGEQLARELRHPSGRRLDPAQRLAGALAEPRILARRAGLGEHADQQVVEVVRDAAGDHAQAVDALRVGADLVGAGAAGGAGLAGTGEVGGGRRGRPLDRDAAGAPAGRRARRATPGRGPASRRSRDRPRRWRSGPRRTACSSAPERSRAQSVPRRRAAPRGGVRTSCTPPC